MVASSSADGGATVAGKGYMRIASCFDVYEDTLIYGK
jgi:hypothetical protein